MRHLQLISAQSRLQHQALRRPEVSTGGQALLSDATIQVLLLFILLVAVLLGPWL